MKLDEEKSKHVTLAQQNGFLAQLRLVKDTAKKIFLFAPKKGQEKRKKKAQQSLTPAKEECNKYDLTAIPCFQLANHNDWSQMVCY